MAKETGKGAKAQASTSAAAPKKKVVYGRTTLPVWKSILLLMLAAVWSPVSQILLSPTHGAIPAAAYHRMLTINVGLLIAPLDMFFLATLPLEDKEYYVPILAASIPMVQRFLAPTANFMGPVASAALIDLLTYGALAALTFNVTWQGLRRLVPRFVKEPVRTFAPLAIAPAIFMGTETVTRRLIPSLMGSGRVWTRTVLPFVLSLYTAMLLPSQYLLYAALPLAHTLLLNPHTPLPVPIAGMQQALLAENYTLLERRDSNTGYISVVQNEHEGFRLMRCDHSILGGEWIYGVGTWLGGEGFGDRPALVGEPVYSVFSMLEAVRLVHTVEKGKPKPKPRSDADSKALVIGLGIGTTPSALITHGINTTVVEIDPLVYHFARKYFALPTNHTAIIEDATEFVEYDTSTYDYIIHDVFTGGAEPAELFTVEFIQALHNRLKPKGVIAINYASDLRLPPASLTVRTIRAVFPNCRIYREHPPETATDQSDFTNMIFFCRKGDKPFAFRQPIEADYLGSLARRELLLPQHEIDIQQFDLVGTIKGAPNVLHRGEEGVLAQWQRESAVGHWKVMRQVVPAVVWENW